MLRIFRAVLLLTLILCACSSSGPSPEAVRPTDTVNASTAEVLPLPTVIAAGRTPQVDQGPDETITEVSARPQDCGYQWAYQDLPELSGSFQASIQALQPEAQAGLFAFGEDCVRNDGSKSFIPMETDFNATLQVVDLSNESDLGEWVVKVMQVVENIPSEQIVGPMGSGVGSPFT
jgi:hypothetical protein